MQAIHLTKTMADKMNIKIPYNILYSSTDATNNRLFYELEVSDILSTSDGSQLDAGCTASYASEWKQKMGEMVKAINDEELCKEDTAYVVSYTDFFASMGSQVGLLYAIMH